MNKLEHGGAGVQPSGHKPSVEEGSAHRRPLQHWLSQPETWRVLAAAGAISPRKVAAAARCCLPVTRPPEGTGWKREYTWPELLTIAAHLSGEVQ